MPDPTPYLAASEPPPRARRLKRALLVLAIALGLAILEAAQGRFYYGNMPGFLFWPEAFARTLPSWLAFSILVPLVFAFSRAVRLDRHRARHAIPLYVVAGVVFVVLHLGSSALAETLRHPGSTLERYFRYFLMRHAVADFLLFGGLVGVAHFARHQDELRARERAESELRAGLAEARLQALKAQLHPHFLFNTLNAVHALALTGDREQLLTTIRALSELLRIVLDETPGDQGTVESEMRFLDRYFEIQQVRFGARLTIEREVPGEVLAARVPSLILQPLVENALEHGIGRRAGPGRVAIRAMRDGDVLELRVEDTGPGFVTGGERSEGHGLGLENTRMRLEHLYGTAASLTCEDRAGGGARVTVRLPWNVAAPPVTEAHSAVVVESRRPAAHVPATGGAS